MPVHRSAVTESFAEIDPGERCARIDCVADQAEVENPNAVSIKNRGRIGLVSVAREGVTLETTRWQT